MIGAHLNWYSAGRGAIDLLQSNSSEVLLWCCCVYILCYWAAETWICCSSIRSNSEFMLLSFIWSEFTQLNSAFAAILWCCKCNLLSCWIRYSIAFTVAQFQMINFFMLIDFYYWSWLLLICYESTILLVLQFSTWSFCFNSRGVDPLFSNGFVAGTYFWCLMKCLATSSWVLQIWFHVVAGFVNESKTVWWSLVVHLQNNSKKWWYEFICCCWWSVSFFFFFFFFSKSGDELLFSSFSPMI